MRPYTLVASTTFSRRPPPCANQRPRICSVHPSPIFHPYTFAVSKKFSPNSSARSMIAKLSASVVSGPKFMVPRQSRLTLTPERPSCTYCMAPLSSASDADRFDAFDLVRREREPIGPQIVRHVLCIRGARQRDHPDLHREPKHYLGHAGPICFSHGANGGVDKDFPVGGEQRKALIHNAMSATQIAHGFVPPEGRIATVLDDHGTMRRPITQNRELACRDVADPDELRPAACVQRFNGRPHFPILRSQAAAMIGTVQHVGIEIVGVKMGQ